MGNGACHGEKYDKEAAQINREIENRLLKERRQGEEYKLLLLGTGESGKSTIAKQMKIIHLSGFTKEEKIGFRTIVYNNVVKGAQSLILAARKRNLSFQSPEEVEMIEGLPPSINHYPVDLAKSIANLWRDPNIQIAYNESQLSDSTN